MTVRNWIDIIKLNLEDRSFHPQFVRALPNHLVYTYLSVVKDSVIILSEEAREQMPDREPEIYTLKCIEMIDVPANLCPCVPPRGCQWRRSKNSLPDFIGNKLDFVSETTVQGEKLEYHYIEPSLVSTLSSSRLSGRAKKYTIIDTNNDDYLYILTSAGRKSKFLLARSPFTDFLKIVQFNDCTSGQICNFLDQDYGIDPRYKDLVLTSVTQRIANFLSVNSVADTRDDGLDGSVMTGDT